MISKRAENILPYTAGEQPAGKKFIKLNTNENPYPPSESVKKTLENFEYRNLKLYPQPDSDNLRKVIAEKEKVDTDNIFLGNGSDEILAFAFCALFDGNIAFGDITYSFYPVYCQLFDITYNLVPLREDFSINENDYIGKNYGGIVIANPNAPTSISMRAQNIEKIIKNTKYNVVVDEAYIDFATKSQSVVPLINKYNNLLVVKTFSKSYSLAGIRCGYAVGDKKLIDALNKIKNSFNSYPLDKVCQEVCINAISDEDYFNSNKNKVIKTRIKIEEELTKMGAIVLPSDTNFLFVKVKGHSGKDVYEFLRENGILVRHWDKPKISDYLRITIGTDREMEILINKMKQLL